MEQIYEITYVGEEGTPIYTTTGTVFKARLMEIEFGYKILDMKLIEERPL